MAFTPDETRRYARHLVLKGIGGPGQQKLQTARVLMVGAGGLGSPAIAYLAAAGVGTLGICDHDTVAVSNLQRQIIHATGDIGTTKAESAAGFVRDLNPHVTIVPHAERFRAELIGPYDIVLDGTDQIDVRVEIADACAAVGKPLVSGSVYMFDGQVTVFLPGPGKPTFRDLYPNLPTLEDTPSCEAVGVLGAVTGVIGTLMAMEAIKLITGVGEPLVGRLLLYDGKAARFSEVAYG
jgi:molybdopterin/thiamine biosynthesis adenylyltransferase